jgi:hypothetical protein
MRRVFVSLLFWVLALNAFGQLAPDIAKGTTAEEVIRVYGWPKGKGVAEERESWLYDRFQVMFQQGKVVSVSYIATTTPEPVKLAAPPAARVPDPGTLKKSPTPSTVPTSPPVRPSTTPGVSSPRPTRNTPSSDYLVTAPKSKPNEPPSSFGSTKIWVVTGVSAAGILMGMLILAINRREASAKLSNDILEQQRRETYQKRKSWEEEVAEKLRGANGSKAPPIVGTVRKSGMPVDTSSAVDRPTPEPPVLDRELTLELLRKLEWKRFELLTVLYLGTTGIRAQATCTGADGGVDAYLFRNGEEKPFSYVQCKAWGLRAVDVKPVRELFGVMAANDIREGYLFATGEFTPDARAFVAGRQLKLVSGNDVIAQFKQLPPDVRQRILSEVTTGDYTTPTCPSCDVKLVLREIGADKNSFWGCRNYPRCRVKIYQKGDAITN